MHHVWHLSAKQLIAQVDAVVHDCMTHGETGWPPHTGGMVTVDDNPFNGPLQIEVYGMQNYKEFDEKYDLGTMGVLSGLVDEAIVFQQWFQKQHGPGYRDGTRPTLWRPEAGRNDTTA
ncbi:MAG: hypothetical protein Q9169_005898 [Polycauliona sp. 2 TL-2023]